VNIAKIRIEVIDNNGLINCDQLYERQVSKNFMCNFKVLLLAVFWDYGMERKDERRLF